MIVKTYWYHLAEKMYLEIKKKTYVGVGSPSASHSMMKGLSFSSGLDLTWKSSSSVGGCFTIRGGLWTGKKNKTCIHFMVIKVDEIDVDAVLKGKTVALFCKWLPENLSKTAQVIYLSTSLCAKLSKNFNANPMGGRVTFWKRNVKTSKYSTQSSYTLVEC